MSNKITKLSPVNNTVLYELDMSSKREVDSACVKAKAALLEWKSFPVHKRINILRTFSEIIRKNKDTIINSICDEIGKPFAEAEVEVIECGDIIDFYTSQSYDNLSQWTEISIDNSIWKNKTAYKVYSPVGVYAIIKPWNYPFEMPIWSIIPILIAGIQLFLSLRSCLQKLGYY